MTQHWVGLRTCSEGLVLTGSRHGGLSSEGIALGQGTGGTVLRALLQAAAQGTKVAVLHGLGLRTDLTPVIAST